MKVLQLILMLIWYYRTGYI